MAIIHTAAAVIFSTLTLSAYATDCDKGIDIQQLRAGKQFSGFYENDSYYFEFRIPEQLVGYADVNTSYQHGLSVPLNNLAGTWIQIYAEPNSLLHETASAAGADRIRFAKAKGRLLLEIDNGEGRLGELRSNIGTLKYRCPGIEKEFVEVAYVALSPAKNQEYSVILYSDSAHLKADKENLEKILNSWRYTGHER